MPNTKNLFDTKQQTLLRELESIKHLLDEQPVDNIPVLQDTVTTNAVKPINSIKQEALYNEPPVTPINGVLPGQQPLFNETVTSQTLDQTITAKTNHNNRVSQQQTTNNLKAVSLAQNPFLPKHVRERLQNNLYNESGNTNSTPTPNKVNGSYTQRLVDELVAHHLPRIEAELRLKLFDVVKNHNDLIKK